MSAAVVVLVAGGGGRGGRRAPGRAAAPTGPVPYKRTAEFPRLGTPDSTDDLRATAGPEAMKALYEFVQQGGTLITEGGTASIFPNLGLTPGVKMESPARRCLRVARILRGMIADRTSPLVYGYEFDECRSTSMADRCSIPGTPRTGCRGCCAERRWPRRPRHVS